MGDKNRETQPKRQYPPIWEKLVPIAVGAIAVLMAILFLIIIAVALGLFQGTR